MAPKQDPKPKFQEGESGPGGGRGPAGSGRPRGAVRCGVCPPGLPGSGDAPRCRAGVGGCGGAAASSSRRFPPAAAARSIAAAAVGGPGRDKGPGWGRRGTAQAPPVPLRSRAGPRRGQPRSRLLPGRGCCPARPGARPLLGVAQGGAR